MGGLFNDLFSYLFMAARGLYPVAVSGGYFPVAIHGLLAAVAFVVGL